MPGEDPRRRSCDDRGVIGALRELSHGHVLGPGDLGYHAARRVWNARIDVRPAALVRVASAAEVQAVLRFARERGIDVSVRGTGHHVAGLAVREGGLVIDLSGLQTSCWIRCADRARRARSDMGRAGSWDADGGARRHRGARLVRRHRRADARRRLRLADAALRAHDRQPRGGGCRDRRRRAATCQCDDYRTFWGLRGGGGALGIVTRFEYAAPGRTVVTAGAAFYDIEHLPQILRGFRALMATAPDELGASATSCWSPAAPFVPPQLHGRLVVAIALCHTGRPDLDSLQHSHRRC